MISNTEFSAAMGGAGGTLPPLTPAPNSSSAVRDGEVGVIAIDVGRAQGEGRRWVVNCAILDGHEDTQKL